MAFLSVLSLSRKKERAIFGCKQDLTNKKKGTISLTLSWLLNLQPVVGKTFLWLIHMWYYLRNSAVNQDMWYSFKESGSCFPSMTSSFPGVREGVLMALGGREGLWPRQETEADLRPQDGY